MSDNGNLRSSGIGLFGAVFVVFLVLKLIGIIGWSWWWVTSPLWIGFALWSVIFIVAFVLIFKWKQDAR